MTKAQTAAWNYVAEFRFHRLKASTHASSLRDLDELEAAIEMVRRRAVIDMVQHEYTWSEIAEALGMSRQGASQKYRRFVK